MKHHRWPAFLALLMTASIGVPGASGDDAKRLPAEDRKLLLSPVALKSVTSTAAIPASVRTAFAALAHQPSFEMAEPSEEFQVGDAVMDRRLPGRRLIFAAFDDGLCVLHYERGGIAHLYYVLGFGLGKGKDKDAQLRWGVQLKGKVRDLAALREEVLAGRLDTVRVDYPW